MIVAIDVQAIDVQTLSYSIQALGWSLLGAIVGYVLGRIDRNLDAEPASRRARVARRIASDKNLLMGIAVLVIATISLVLSGVNEHSNRVFRARQSRITSCQAEYNEAVVSAMLRRADAAGQDRDSLDNMLKTVATATQSAQVETALQKYLHDRAQADADRARNPLPQPPNCKKVG